MSIVGRRDPLSSLAATTSPAVQPGALAGENHRQLDALMLAAVDELAEETGEDPENVRAGLQEMAATVDVMLRRVLVVAEKL